MAPSLPTEIIQLILRALRADASKSAAATLSLSAISRHWRAVALSTPSLWATFSFSLRTHDEAMLSAFFERSLREPLHVTISIDVRNAREVGAAAIQRALTVFLREADRIEHLHLRFFTPMHDESDLIGKFVCFQSSGLESLEIESLADREGHERLVSELYTLVTHYEQTWSERCPALTRITCTDPRLLGKGPSNMSYMCIKGKGNALDCRALEYVLARAKTAELVIDGISLYKHQDFRLTFPHLHTLSLRDCPRLDGYGGMDPNRAASFLRAIYAPALVAITIYDMNENLPMALFDVNARMPSITRLTILGLPDKFIFYPAIFPNVEELILLGSHPKLLAFDFIVDLSPEWPHLRMIDLAKLAPPPRQSLKEISEYLFQYGRVRVQSGSYSRVLLRLPRGILPEDLTPEAGEFMDLRPA